MKKLLIVGVLVFAFALAVTPALAANYNFSMTNSYTSSKASTGGNEIERNFGGFNTIATGDAISSAKSINVANTNVSGGWSFGSSSNYNTAFTNSTTKSSAKTGGNEIESNFGGVNGIYTGGALSGATSINLVNSNVKLGF